MTAAVGRQEAKSVGAEAEASGGGCGSGGGGETGGRTDEGQMNDERTATLPYARL